VGVVGESGSGKTVVAKAIMGLLPTTASVEGSVRLGDLELLGLPEARRREVYGRRVAMVFQDPATSLNPVRTIGSQLGESLRYHERLGRRAASDRAAELLDRVEIPSARARLRQYPHELSGGMRQRVVIAMALSCGPELLVADEPTTALDVTVQRTILDLLDRLRAEDGMGVILITHDLAVARGRCDDVAVLYAGRAVETGPAHRLFDATRHHYTAALLAAAPDLRRPRHLPLTPIPGRVPDLDDRLAGCRFAPRCARATLRCGTERPDGSNDGSHHWWCFHPLGGEPPVAAGRVDHAGRG
jgi:peptide/nickel transport system ATP-binding protein